MFQWIERVFVHTLSLAINGNLSQSNKCRKLICNEILQNFSSWQNLVHHTNENVTSSGDYQKIMVNGSGYATICEITVPCTLLQTNVHLYLNNIKCFTKQIFDLNEEQFIFYYNNAIFGYYKLVSTLLKKKLSKIVIYNR